MKQNRGGRIKAAALALAGVFCISLALSACSAPEQLPAPAVHGVKDGALVWQAVDGAGGYAVSAGGAETRVDGQNNTSFAPEFAAPGDYTLRVRALAADEKHQDSEWSSPIEVKKLAPPTAVLENGTISWNAVPGAEGYEVYKNGAPVEELSDLSYEIAGAKDGDAFTVAARNVFEETVFDSDPSGAVTVVSVGGNDAPEPKELGAPQNLTYKNGVLKWDAVAGADHYIVRTGDPGFLTAKGTTYDLGSLDPGKYVITVQAVDKNGAASAQKAQITVTVTRDKNMLPAVENLAVRGDTLSWSPVAHASGYVITALQNGIAIKQAEVNAGASAFDLNSMGLDDGTYELRVYAKGGGSYTNSPSRGVTYWRASVAVPTPTPVPVPTPTPTPTPVPTPTPTPTPTKPPLGALQNVRVEAGVLKWDELENAGGYAITVNGQTYSVAAAGPYEFSLSALNLPAGTYTVTYTVTIYGKGGAQYADSPKSAAAYTVTKLAKPANLAFDAPTETLTWNAVAGATGYTVVFGSRAPQAVNTESCVIAGVTPGTYTVTVQATSTDPDVRPSDKASMSCTMPKWDLGALQNVRIEKGFLKWDALANASSYEVKVLDSASAPVAGPTTISAAGSLQYDIYAQNLPMGSYTVTLRAKGDPVNYNDSAIVSTPYTEGMIRDAVQYANFSYGNIYPGEPDKYWVMDYTDFSLKQGMTFDEPASFDETALNAAYYTFLTAADGSAEKNAAAAFIGSDVIASYYYEDGGNQIPLTTIKGNPLIKNKLWDGWLWADSGGTGTYAPIAGSGEVPDTTVGGAVPAGAPLRISSNIARMAVDPPQVASITSYSLDQINGKTLYVQIDVIYKDGGNVSYYRVVTEMPVTAYTV